MTYFKKTKTNNLVTSVIASTVLFLCGNIYAIPPVNPVGPATNGASSSSPVSPATNGASVGTSGTNGTGSVGTTGNTTGGINMQPTSPIDTTGTENMNPSAGSHNNGTNNNIGGQGAIPASPSGAVNVPGPNGARQDSNLHANY